MPSTPRRAETGRQEKVVIACCKTTAAPLTEYCKTTEAVPTEHRETVKLLQKYCSTPYGTVRHRTAH